MKKIFVFFALVFTLVGLVGCSRVSASYADKVNAAAENKEHLTYEQVMKDLGDEAQDWTADVPVVGRGGVIYAIKGVTTKEEFEEIIDSEEDVECLIITIAGDKAISAKYSTTKDVESK